MFKTRWIRFLRLLRTPSFRGFFATVTARLCGASLAGSAYLYYVDGSQALAAIGSLWIVAATLFVAAFAANLGE